MPDSAQRSGFSRLDLMFRPFRGAISFKRSFFHPQGKHRLLPFPVFAKYSFWLSVFRCFYTPLEMSGVLFPWLLFLKSSFGNGTTYMTQKIFFSRTGHLCEETMIASELGVSCVLGLILILRAGFFFLSKLFPKHLPLDEKSPARLPRADLMIRKEKPWPRITEYVQLIKHKVESQLLTPTSVHSPSTLWYPCVSLLGWCLFTLSHQSPNHKARRDAPSQSTFCRLSVCVSLTFNILKP